MVSPTPRLVVAVDDMPERYTELCRRVRPMGWVVVTIEHPRALVDLLDHSPVPVLAVLLDHDLRPIWTDEVTTQALREAAAGQPTTRWAYDDCRAITGLDYARDILAARSVPVLITSANLPGATRIAAVLRDAEVPHRQVSCIEAMPEDRWIGVLAEWAAGGGR